MRRGGRISDFLSMYSVGHWLESCPQGCLAATQYGHRPSEGESELILSDPLLREQAIGTTVQLVVGERCALAASSGLINSAPDEASKRFLATQTLDEARHVEVFTQRLFDLGLKKSELESEIHQYANPNLMKFAEVLLEKVDRKDFVAGMVGQNVVLEGMALSVFEMMYAGSQTLNPKFAHTLAGTIADERRHVGFGENRIGSLIQEYPEKKPAIERMQKEMSYYMLATFADSFRNNPARELMKKLRGSLSGDGAAKAEWHGADLNALEPEEMERLLADTVLKEFKIRLGRIGIEYQTPGWAIRDEGADVHALEPEAFLEEVHSFEFWFHSVQGYLAGQTFGHRPDVHGTPLAPNERERLVTVLCNYCVGETAALEGASGLVAITRNRLTKVFLATQVADEGRHLEVLLHRLGELGVPAPETEIARRAALLHFKRRLLELVQSRDWEAAIFAQNVILEAMEFTVFQSHARTADLVTREVLQGIVKDERRHIGFGENGFGENELDRRLHASPHIRARISEVKEELDH